ncbi:MAG: SBBP repeat-containing protein, partial [Planctomycetota bacterium]
MLLYQTTWSQQIGTSDQDYGECVAVDAFGNAYISGRTHGSLYGPNAGHSDAFVTKYDSAGTLLWSQQIGTSSSDMSFAIALDAIGNVYISGRTDGSLGGPNLGIPDAFLVKYDSSGTLLWSQQFGTSSSDTSTSVAVDASGNAYISGITSGGLGGPNAGGADAFLVKYD